MKPVGRHYLRVFRNRVSGYCMLNMQLTSFIEMQLISVHRSAGQQAVPLKNLTSQKVVLKA